MTRYARLKKDLLLFSTGLIVGVDEWANYSLRENSDTYLLTFNKHGVIIKRDGATDLLEFLDEAPTG